MAKRFVLARALKPGTRIYIAMRWATVVDVIPGSRVVAVDYDAAGMRDIAICDPDSEFLVEDGEVSDG